jgi:energy-coupling factor transporter ATP-binding protein EcfA2
MSTDRENATGERPLAGLARELPKFLGLTGRLRKELGLSGLLTGEDGFEALRARMSRHALMGGREVLVATLYGPTGAGKSTLFRLLTGIPVPAGDEVRPVSYASALAAPSALANVESLTTLLSGLEPVGLSHPDELKNKATGTGVIFFAPYERPDGLPQRKSGTDEHGDQSGVELVLADVPDFNSLESRNWERAEKLLRQAEVVVFLLTPDTYADQVTVRELERACRVAARMILVFTKVLAVNEAEGRRKTRAKWDDIINVKLSDTSDAWGKVFASKRGDERTLLEFLSTCPVYYSHHSFHTNLASFISLEEGQEPLSDWLHGHQAGRILLEGIAAPGRDAAKYIEYLLENLDALVRELKTDFERARGPVATVARAIASSEFPLGRMIEVVHEETAKRMPTWYRNIARPTGWAMEQISKPIGWAMDRMSMGARTLGNQLLSLWGQGTQSGEIASTTSIEAKRVEEGTEILFKEWRERFPRESREGGLLDTKRLMTLRENFLAKPVPPRSDLWEKSLREEAAKWAHAQTGSRAMMLHITGRLLVVGGAAMMAIDLVTTGGLVTLPLMAATGKVGIAAAAATGSITAGALMGWVEKLNLQRVLGASEAAFRDQRSLEIADHLQILCNQTFEAPTDRLKRLAKLQEEAEPAGRSVLACLDRIKTISSPRENQSGEQQTREQQS